MAEDELPSEVPPAPTKHAFDFDEGSITALLDTFVEAHTVPQKPQSSHPPDPDDAGAQAAQRTVFQHAPRREALPLVGNDRGAQGRRIELLEALAAHATGSGRARLLAAAAELHDKLGDAEAAIDAYRRALQSDARDVVSVRALRHHALRRQDWLAAAEYIRQEASLELTPEERAAALSLLSTVHRLGTGDVAAAERAARESAEAQPEDFAARLAVAAACLARGDLAGGGAALAEAADRWPQSHAQAVLLQHAGELTEQGGDLAAARSLYERATALDPGSFAARIGLVRASHALGDFEACMRALQELSDQTEDLPLRCALRRTAGAIGAGRLRETAAALDTLAGDGNATTMWTAADIAAGDGDLVRAAQALEESDSQTGRARAERLRVESKPVGNGGLPATDDTRESDPLEPYRRAIRRLRGDDDGSELRLVLDAMHVAPKSTPADIVGADKAALIGDGAAFAASLERAVDRASDRLGDVLALAEIADEVAVGARRKAFDLTDEREDRDAILCRALAMEDHEDAQNAAARWRAEAVGSSGSQAAFAFGMAARYHLRAGATEEAARCLEAAIDQRVDYLPALWSLEDGPFEHDIRLGSAVKQASLGGSTEAEAWLRASMWTSDPLERQNHAEAALTPGAPDALLAEWLLPSLGMLTEAAASLLESTIPDEPEQRDLRAARALLGAGLPGRAARILRKLVEQRPDDDNAASILEEAEIEASEFARVADAMMRRAREATDEAGKLAALATMASVDRLARRDMLSARLSLQSIAESCPSHLPTARALEWDALRERDTERILSSVRRMIDCLEPETPERAARRRLLVEVWNADDDILTNDVDRLLRGIDDDIDPDPGLARRVLGMAYARGEEETALRALASLQSHLQTDLERSALALERAHVLDRMGAPERALAILADSVDHPLGLELEAHLLQAAGHWEDAAAAYDRAALHAKDGRRAASLWRESAVILEEKLDDVDRATAAYVQATESDITYNDVYRRLVSLYRRTGRSAEAEKLTDLRIEAGDDTPNLVALLLEQAEQRRERGDLDAVVASLEECLELDPSHFTVLRELVETHRTRQDWQGTTEALIRIARLRRSPDEQGSAFAQLAEIYDAQLDDQPRAEAALRQVLKLTPAHTETLDHLARVLSTQGKANEAARVLDDLVGRTERDPRQVDYRIRLAAAIESAGHSRQAEAYLEQLRTERPTDVDVILALADHFDRQGAPAACAMHLNRALSDLRTAIDERPQEELLWTALVRVLLRRHGAGAASCAASTALALGLPSASFEGFVDEDHTTLGTPVKPLPRDVDRFVTPRALPPTALRLFALCEQGFDKTLPVDTTYRNLKRVPSKLRSLVVEAAGVAEQLGMAEPKVRMASGATTTCFPLVGDPTALVVGEALLEETTPAERAFMFARALTAAGAHLAPALRATPEALDAVLVALLGNHEASRVNRQPPANATDMRRIILRSVSRRQRDEVEGLVLEIRGDVDFSARTLPLAVAELGNRTALVLTGDVPSAVSALLKARGESIPSAPSARLALIRDTLEVWELVRFALSDGHFEARAQAGVDR